MIEHDQAPRKSLRADLSRASDGIHDLAIRQVPRIPVLIDDQDPGIALIALEDGGIASAGIEHVDECNNEALDRIENLRVPDHKPGKLLGFSGLCPATIDTSARAGRFTDVGDTALPKARWFR